jgi:hypothetical protein
MDSLIEHEGRDGSIGSQVYCSVRSARGGTFEWLKDRPHVKG